VDVLYGSVAPSGKLPYTIGKAQADYGTAIASGDDSYSEGLYIDYRHFDNAGITPRYEFGFGLSYTTFAYSGLTLSAISTTAGSTADVPGGFASLYDIAATVTATITNIGSVTGAEVPQLYIGMPTSAPASPPKQLRGFSKLSLSASASGTATFKLRRKDLSYWDTASQAWILPAGTFNVYVGASSRDIRLSGTISASGSSVATGSTGSSSATSTTKGTTTVGSTLATSSTSKPTSTSSTSKAATTTSASNGTGASLYGQCGGTGCVQTLSQIESRIC
jgi:beta-glucosidase